MRVSAQCSKPNQLAGLMHDAFEAYGKDLPSPIKQDLPAYKRIENRVMEVIAKKFGFEWPKSAEVEHIDQLEMKREWDLFMCSSRRYHPGRLSSCF